MENENELENHPRILSIDQNVSYMWEAGISRRNAFYEMVRKL